MIKDAKNPPTTTPTQNTGANGLAVTSLVLGIVSFTGFGLLTGVPAIITGILALKKGQQERAMSIAGIIMGGIATLISLLFIGLIIFFAVLGMMAEPSFQQEQLTPDYQYQMESSRT
ncbi:MAG TPA: DUF4190 domain-containing protein [Candidatus Saccharimonadales bacterium]|jgi:hypothetical protein|nr:DUF4190 domain-containing protein [Candidatus Saccharimonadales bacterium]